MTISHHEKEKKSIKTRILQTMAIPFIFMFLLLYAVFFISMRSLLGERELDNMINQAKLAENVLVSSVSYLPSITRDWSSWDYTYDYVLGDYDEFLDDYLTEYPFQLFRLNFLAVLDVRGDIVYEGYYDFWNAAFMENPPDLSGLYEVIGPLTVSTFDEKELLDLTNTTQIGMAGFVSHDQSIYYLSSYPVLRSDETGPCAGAFIFGRIIDDAEMAFLTKDSEISFSVSEINNTDISAGERESLLANRSIVIAHDDSATTFELFADIFGNDTLAVSISSPRTLYSEGSNFINIVLGVAALCCIIVLFVIFNLLNKTIAVPLTEMAAEIKNINMEKTGASLNFKSNTKEMDNIANAINDMLFRIKNDRDIIRTSNEILNYSANYDILTGLKNRTSTIKDLNTIIQKAKANLNTITVFFIDLNRFKFINDTLGHNLGNNFIILVANRLKKEFGEDALLSRMGGDEFAIVIESLKDDVEEQFFAERIFNVFKTPFRMKEREFLINVAIGSSSYPEDGQDAETMIKTADIAMYRAKDQGENSYVPYKKEFHAALQRKIYIENKIRSAINNNCREFRAFFQPKLSVETGEITSSEALIRWMSPEGVIGPLEFIPQAEESGLIIPLSWWMIRECCRIGKLFEQEGIDNTIAINISAQVLLHEDFIPVIRSAIEETGIDVRKLDIEITESTLLDDMEKVNTILRELHNVGMEISVDDFGTGYSSLSYLHKLSVDRIKIDRSFIIRIDEEDDDKAIINAIVAMGKSLHMVITAEGVEDESQYAFLKSIKCDEIQGYYISKPLPYDEYIDFMKQWNNNRKGMNL
ncbi:EAL domain-containing protein [Brucepastera parasyntrophica]|uniref:EAL domain-containing protein n=1 Tax=Brucepastera parasyntrophica TaxID=2880008 RepID=UPI00210BCBF8|nr:EAL domain-containing protein [Brucepastera parasyntrophica]ULQ60849.1 EAL domain-containing protein [Brucepastera parasyntrophica]